MTYNQTMLRTLLVGFALLGAAPSISGQESPRALRAVEAVHISADQENLSRLGSVEIGPRGALVIGQPQDRSVIVVDSLGRRTFAFGRKGSGPGEFQSLTRTAWLGDSLWVYDRTSRRTTVISPQGKLIRNVSLSLNGTASASDPNSRFVQIQPLAPLRDGRMLAAATLPPNGATVTPVTWIVELTADGNVSRRVVELPEDSCMRRSAQAQVRLSACGSPQWELSAVAGRVVAAIGKASGEGGAGTYRLSVWSTTGQQLWSQVRQVPLARIASALRDSLKMAIDSAPGAAAELLRTVPLPTFHPAIVGMVVGQDGTIWVQLGVQDASGRALWDVWSRDGTVFGRVALPERTYPLSIRAGQMVAKVESADGFQDVVKFRVQ